MKKTFLFFALAIVAIAAFASAMKPINAPAKTNSKANATAKKTDATKADGLVDTVKIGVILPLSGNNMNLGQPQKPVIRLIESELAQKPAKHEYQFIIEDDQLTPRLTAEVTNKLINVDHVAAIMSLSSGCGNVVSPMAQSAKVIHICMGASDPRVAAGPYNFINWARPEEEAVLFGKLVQKLKAKRVAFLVCRQQGLMAIANAARNELKRLGIPYMQVEYFNPDERDFRPYLLKVSQHKPDLFVPLAFSPALEIILRQNKQFGYFNSLSTIESFDLAEDTSLCEGIPYVSAARPTAEFAKKLATVSNAFNGFGQPYTYDSLHMIIDALEQSNTPNTDRSAALAFMQKIKSYPGAVGEVNVDSEGIFHSPAGLYKFVNGKSTAITLDSIIDSKKEMPKTDAK